MANPPASEISSLKDSLQMCLTKLESIGISPPMADEMDFPTFRDEVIRRFDTITKRLESLERLDQALETLTISIAALRSDIRSDIAALDCKTDQRFDEMKLQIMAVEHNSIARLSNQTVTRPTDRLSPLRGSNNDEIQNFPVSFSAIKNLPAPELDRLLLALDLLQTGGLEDKRIRLIQHIKGWHLA